jgi:hypothetical protein
MNNYLITFLFYFVTFAIVFNINFGLVYSLKYVKIDDNVLPLLIPPYKHSNDLSNESMTKIVNITYSPSLR